MKTELKVEGMTCAHCERAVHNALEAVPGVTAVQVDRDQGRASVTGEADLQALLSAVAEEGYSAEDAAA